MALTKAMNDWLASLPRTGEFSLETVYQSMLTDHPRQAPGRSRCSSAILVTGLFERWKDPQGAVMFRYRGPKA